MNGVYWALDKYSLLQQYKIPRNAQQVLGARDDACGCGSVCALPPQQPGIASRCWFTRGAVLGVVCSVVVRARSFTHVFPQLVPPELLQRTLRSAVVGGLLLQFPSAMALYYGMQHFGSDIQGQVPALGTVYLQARESSSWTQGDDVCCVVFCMCVRVEGM